MVKGVDMSDNLIVLNLLEEERITFEEALQLLSAKTVNQPPYLVENDHKIEVKLIFERGNDVRD